MIDLGNGRLLDVVLACWNIAVLAVFLLPPYLAYRWAWRR